MSQQELLIFGEPLANQDPAGLTIAEARQAAAAVREHSDFALRELRSTSINGKYSEILIVDCTCDAIWPQNPVGINYREPFALRFFSNRERTPEARALRRDFPVLLHTNDVPQGEPVSLCLYAEPWSTTVRTWTAQKFLTRIQWWLVQSASSSLHLASQPPEQLYFESPYSVVLPAGFDSLDSNAKRSLILKPRSPESSPRLVLTAQARSPSNSPLDLGFEWVSLHLPPIPHARPERNPSTLGELDDRLTSRGAPLAEALFREIQQMAAGGGLPFIAGQQTLLILTVPVVNPAGGSPRVQRKGFLIQSSLGELGSAAGVLTRMPNPDRYVAPLLIGGLQLSAGWKTLGVEVVEIHESLNDEGARLYSGLDGAGPSGVLAGLGALGSAVADIWMREGWGTWSYLDPDLLLPHNLARHRGYEFQIGVPKAQAVEQLHNALYPGRQLPTALQASVTDFDNEQVSACLSQAELIVDVTTTVEVPRDLSLRDASPRVASIFLTPSGGDSVLLLEDAERTIRLDSLEAQYYRFVLAGEWGKTHLLGHNGDLWVGTGCRDISTILSGELVQLHAAVLARQVRLRSQSPDPVIQVWRNDGQTGIVETMVCTAAQAISVDLPTIRLVWDEGLRQKLRSMRSEGLPNETGGVLLGYFDLINRGVYVVDALPAPSDSLREKSGFERGVAGLEDQITEASQKTANIVGYIGEWHSHPQNVEAQPSNADLKLLLHLAVMLQQDGLPALMLIVGEHDESWLVGNVVTP